MSRLDKIFRPKAHGQQVIKCDHLDVGFVELFAMLILNCGLYGLCSIRSTPIASDHENTSFEAAVFANHLSADTTRTAAALQVTCNSNRDNVAALNSACRVLFCHVELIGSDECLCESSAFCTDCASVRRVLVVCAEDYFAPFGEQCGSYAELAVWRIGQLSRLLGGVKQVMLLVGEQLQVLDRKSVV